MVEAGGVHQSEVVDYCHKNAAMTKSRQRKAKKHVLLFVVVVYFSVAVNSQWGSSALPRFKHLDFNAAKVLETR